MASVQNKSRRLLVQELPSSRDLPSQSNMATRLCVKGLSKATTEKDLKTLFATKGEVTDVKIIKTINGKTRQFAFIGFRTSLQAAEAQKYFHNTFLDTARVAVEFAIKVGDDSLAPAKHAGKHTLKKVAAGKGAGGDGATEQSGEKDKSSSKGVGKGKGQGQGQAETKEASKIDRTKQDFLEVMKKRTDARFWANDEADASKEEKFDRVDDDEDDDEDEVDDDEDGDDDVNDLMSKAKPVANISDMDYLRSKVMSKFSDDDEDDEDEIAPNIRRGDDEEDEDKDEDENENEDKTNAAGTKLDSDSGDAENDQSRLFLRNLPFTTTESELTVLFQPFGDITEIHVPLDKERNSKGIGYVQFMFPEHACAARSSLDGTSFQGRVLHILASKKQKEVVEMESKSKSRLSSFQQKKEEERRLMAGKKEGWNSAFIRSDAVVDSLADKYGLDRSDILDTAEAGGEMAVRLAIGEAHVIQENRDYFASHGVDIAALESSNGVRAAARSTTTILIKNLPFDMIPDELESMFTSFGSVASFLVPKSKTVALVDFVEPSVARQAFKGLAYRRYKHTPLYLEWAPTGIIDRSKAAKKTDKSAAKKVAKNAAAPLVQEEDDGSDFATLYIKNLAFATDEPALRAHILLLHDRAGKANTGGCGLRAVSIPTKKHTTGDSLSKGFGFAEFVSPSHAQNALSILQGSVLDGHSLELKASEKRLSAGSSKASRGKSSSSSSGTNTKLIVRNVAFQATQAELHALFSTFGSVKRVRIPKKMGGVHRGFAFIDFSTPQEAQAAMVSLGSSHLYGRHLVLEWAKEEDEDDEVNRLRKRALVDSSAISSQKKGRKLDEDEMMGLTTKGMNDHI